jgi:hypothetical protein
MYTETSQPEECPVAQQLLQMPTGKPATLMIISKGKAKMAHPTTLGLV